MIAINMKNYHAPQIAVVRTLLGKVNTKVNVPPSRERILMGSTAENKSFLSKRLPKVTLPERRGKVNG